MDEIKAKLIGFDAMLVPGKVLLEFQMPRSAVKRAVLSTEWTLTPPPEVDGGES